MKRPIQEEIDEVSGKLYEAVEGVERQGFWKRDIKPPRDKPIKADVTAFLDKLLAHVMMTDGYYSSQEHALVKHLTKIDQPFHESRSHLESVCEGSPAFFAEVPAFLQSSIAHDRARGSSSAALCVSLIEQVAYLFARTDDLDDLERTYLVRFIAFLRARLEFGGVPYDLSQSGSAWSTSTDGTSE